MGIAVHQKLRLENPISKAWLGLYLLASVPGAIYNREAFPRKRGSALWRADIHVGGFGALSSSDRAVSAGLRPTHSLRQRGDRVAFPGAAITRQGSGRHGRHCLQR